MGIFNKDRKKVYTITREDVGGKAPVDKIRTDFIDKEVYKDGELDGYITESGLQLEKNNMGELWMIGTIYDSHYASFSYTNALEKATEWFYEEMIDSMKELEDLRSKTRELELKIQYLMASKTEKGNKKV